MQNDVAKISLAKFSSHISRQENCHAKFATKTPNIKISIASPTFILNPEVSVEFLFFQRICQFHFERIKRYYGVKFQILLGRVNHNPI